MIRKIAGILIVILMQVSVIAQEENPGELNMPLDETTGLITYQEVVKQVGSQKELFNRAGEWLHQFYVNPVHVTKTRDAASGLIKGQHNYKLTFVDKDGNKLDGGMIIYSFKIECKEGRYRWTVEELFLKRTSRYPLENWLDKSDPSYNPQWEVYLTQFDAFVREEFAPSLKEAMKPKVEKIEEEW